MTIEGWIALAGFVITILTVVFAAGKIITRINLFIDRFTEHEKKDERIFTELFNSRNSHAERLAVVEAHTHGGSVRRFPSGGYAVSDNGDVVPRP